MKTYIKSLLALAAVALLGSSAQAADNDSDTVKAGGTTKEFSYSYGKERWYTLSKVSGSDCVTFQFTDSYPSRPDLSNKAVASAIFTFTAKSDVTERTSATWKLWRCSAHASKPDTVPVFDPSQDAGGKPYSDRSDIWGDCGTYTITVEPADAVIPEDAAVIEGHTVQKLLTGGEAGTEWAASVTGGGDYVTVDTPSGTGAEFACQIRGLTAGNGQVTVTKDGKPFAIYNVKVFDDESVIHLCLGDVLTLNYNPGAKVWNKSQSSGTVVSTEESAGQGTHAGDGTANPTWQSYKLVLKAIAVGEEEVKLVNRGSSDSVWATVDDIMIDVSQAREAMSGTPVSVVVPGTTASAGSTTWTTSVSPSGRATVALSGTSASGATATVTGQEGGEATVTAKNVTGSNDNLKGIEFAMAFSFTAKTRQTGETQNLAKDETATLNDYNWTTAWTAKSLDEGIATVTASGASGEQPVVTALKSGKTEVWVENDTICRVYEVNVTETRTDTLDMMKGDVVDSKTYGAGAAGTWTASSDNEQAVTVTIPAGSAGNTVVPTFTANHKGTATVTLSNPYVTYEITVTVSVIKPEEITPVIVKATRTTLAGGAVREIRYDGFLTEKGCQYAWGKDDEPLEDWSEPSDGTPISIATKPAEATQLFVKRPTK